MKTFFTLVATGLLVVLVIQMAVEFRPEHSGLCLSSVSGDGLYQRIRDRRVPLWPCMVFRFLRDRTVLSEC